MRFRTLEDLRGLVDDEHVDVDTATGGKTTMTAERLIFSFNSAQRTKLATGKFEFSRDQVEKLKKFAKEYMKHSSSIAGTGARWTIAKSLHDGASKQLLDEAKALEFATTGRDLLTCMTEVRRRRPELDWILVGVPVPDDEAQVTLAALED